MTIKENSVENENLSHEIGKFIRAKDSISCFAKISSFEVDENLSKC